MAAAMDIPPFLVRFDSHMNTIKERVLEKFIIKMCVIYTDNSKFKHTVEIKYNIELFKYNINSKKKNDCNNLMIDYHSQKGYGKNCAYIGFFDKNIQDLYYNHFYKIGKTTWFLDYSVIDPHIRVDEITQKNYKEPPMNKKNLNQVKKLSWAEEIEYIETARTRFDDETSEKKIVPANKLPGEHIVIGNADNAIFTLDPIIFYDNDIKNREIIRPELLLHESEIKQFHRQVVFAFLNKKEDFNYTFNSENKNYRFFIENIVYKTPTDTIYIGYDDKKNIHQIIHELLAQLQNNTSNTYAAGNRVRDYNNYPIDAAIDARKKREIDLMETKEAIVRTEDQKKRIINAEKYGKEAKTLGIQAARSRTEARKDLSNNDIRNFYKNVLLSREHANSAKKMYDLITKTYNSSRKNNDDRDDQNKIYGLFISARDAADRASASATDAESLNPVEFNKRKREIETTLAAAAAAEELRKNSFQSSFGTSSDISTLYNLSSKRAAAAKRAVAVPAAAAAAAAATGVAAVDRKRSNDEDLEGPVDKKRQEKYLKYKQKYLELKRKLNLI